MSAGGEDLRVGNRFLLSGEIHYFRVPRPAWGDRLRQMRDLGLNAVSTYVPWNFHQPTPEQPPDFGGSSLPERDLPGFLDLVAGTGLSCVFRPGPFITAEWRNGGLPDWLWELDPGLLALDASGRPAGARSGYQAVTYAHPAYEAAARRWMESALAVARDYLVSAGGPIVNVQLDDEPSYWDQLWHPLALDYNPLLVAPAASGSLGDGPSRYGRWLLDRYGTLAALNASHGARYVQPAGIEPPRTAEGPLAALADWHDFKLSQIDGHVAFLYGIARGAGIDGPVSVLFPYLLPLGAAKFGRFAERRGLDVQLTGEVYLSLFEGASCPEHKLGHIAAAHATYHMWREGSAGVPATMELQASNASYLSPRAMEMLYAATVALGIKGVSFFMAVGGSTPPGFENLLGSAYDVSCPISASGAERPHAAVIRKLARIVEASERSVMKAEPCYDVWCGYYVPNETAALVGQFGEAGAGLTELVRETFSAGEMGTSAAPSLQVLMALSSVNAGAVDLERATGERLAGLRQLWVLSGSCMAEPVQRKLLRYAEQGGDLVVLPGLPRVSGDGTPCLVLAEAAFGSEPVPAFPGMEATGSPRSSMVLTAGGERIVVPGEAAVLPCGLDGRVLARQQETGAPCAVRYSIGAGTLTVLGFRLQYAPTGELDHKSFLLSIVEGSGTPRHAGTTNLDMAAMQLRGPEGGLVCVVNPTEWPQASRVVFTGPSGERLMMPVRLQELASDGKGAWLLPVDQPLTAGLVLRHATAELLGRRDAGDGVELTFATVPGRASELAITGGPAGCELRGGDLLERGDEEGVTVVVFRPRDAETVMRIHAREERG
jgi:beta-galactosidase